MQTQDVTMKPWVTTRMNTIFSQYGTSGSHHFQLSVLSVTIWVHVPCEPAESSVFYTFICSIMLLYYWIQVCFSALYWGLTSALPQAFPFNESLFCYFISQILGKNDHQAQHKTRRLEGTAVLVFLVQRRMKKVKKSKQKPSFSSSYSRIACCLAAAVSITPFSHYFI